MVDVRAFPSRTSDLYDSAQTSERLSSASALPEPVRMRFSSDAAALGDPQPAPLSTARPPDVSTALSSLHEHRSESFFSSGVAAQRLHVMASASSSSSRAPDLTSARLASASQAADASCLAPVGRGEGDFADHTDDSITTATRVRRVFAARVGEQRRSEHVSHEEDATLPPPSYSNSKHVRVKLSECAAFFLLVYRRTAANVFDE